MISFYFFFFLFIFPSQLPLSNPFHTLWITHTTIRTSSFCCGHCCCWFYFFRLFALSTWNDMFASYIYVRPVSMYFHFNLNGIGDGFNLPSIVRVRRLHTANTYNTRTRTRTHTYTAHSAQTKTIHLSPSLRWLWNACERRINSKLQQQQSLLQLNEERPAV